MDRISGLPPFIIHQIMSKLSTKEVAQTSVLSKTWKGLHASFPILDFDQTYFVGPVVSRFDFWQKMESKRFRKRLGKFMRFIDHSLLRFCQLNLCMLKFRLIIGLLDYEESSALVDKWITLAVNHEVKEFDFKLFTDGDEVYTLPPIVFSANQVTDIKLFGCKLEQTSGSIMLYSLKKLTLDRVFISEEMVQKLVSECRLLEDMCLSWCGDLKQLSISNAFKLKSLSVYIDTELCEFECFQIAAPSLQQFTLEGRPTLRPQIFDLAGCPQLKMLHLVGIDFTDQEFHQMLSNFLVLEDLSMNLCRLLERIAIRSNQLKKLKFCSCPNLKALELDTPNLLSFIYDTNPLPTFFSIIAPCTWEVHFKLEFESGVEFNHGWCRNLREFLGASKKIEALTLHVRQHMISFNLKEFQESCRSLTACHVEELVLYAEVPPSYYKILLDSVLCICYPKTLYAGTIRDDQIKLLQWLCNELKNRDISCCNSDHIKCWRHYLIDMEIVGFFRHDIHKYLDMDILMKVLHDSKNPRSCFPEGLAQFNLDWC